MMKIFMNYYKILSKILFIFSMLIFFFGIYLFYSEKLMILNYNFYFFYFMFNYEITIDWISIFFLSLILIISSSVIMYSMEYMLFDKNKNRFLFLVYLFILSMFFMIMSPNLISILLGWDGLGLVSFILVIFYMNFKSLNSGMITVIFNRLGDLGLLLSIGWMSNLGNMSIIIINNMNFNEKLLIMVFVFLAAFTKSAQIPFSAWLPAAMAAPTPVSSLVHSSTLVTAGIYLMIHYSNYFFKNNFCLFLLIISLMTLIMSGISANFEMDFKKIIALSTLSQLGLMFFSLSLSLWEYSYFHMLLHAIFKAMLFLCSGIMIHLIFSSQDKRFYSSFFLKNPLISSSFLISSLCLMGFPFLTGFFSKEMIYFYFEVLSFFLMIYFISLMSIGLTSSYMMRMIFYVFILKKNFKSIYFMEKKINLMEKCVILLSILSLIFGFFMMSYLLEKLNFTLLNFNEMYFSLLIIIFGLIMGMMLHKKMYFFMFLKKLKQFFFSLWFLLWMSSNSLIKNLMKLDYFFYSEKGVLEFYGPEGIFNFIIFNNFKLNFFILNSLKLFLLMYILVIFLFFFI